LNYLLFKKISHYSNYILKYKINYFKTSLSSLHIIRSHKNYFNLLNRKSHNNNFLIKIFNRYFSSTNNYSKKNKISDFLFVSNFVNKSELKNIDRYFNQIIEQLKKENKEYNLIYRNLDVKHKNYKIHKHNYYILNDKFKFFTDIYYLLKILNEIRKIIFYKSDKFKSKKKIIQNLFNFKNISSSLNNLNHVDNLMKLTKKLKPKKIFITYEGYPWERMFCKKIKNYDPKIKVFGYYFSVMPKYTNIPLIRLKNDFDPDFILTSSKFITELFKNKKFPKKNILNIGLNKTKVIPDNKKKDKNINCLILPESFDDEIKYLIDFAKKISDKKIAIKFILRLHPSIKDKIYIQNIKRYIGKKNITLSKNSFINDIKKSHLAFYRGSSSIIEASSQNLIPIYIAKRNELSVDVLYKLEKFKPQIKSVDDFLNFYNIYQRNDNCLDFYNKTKILNFCRSYYSKTDKKIISKIINMPVK
jgi:hypothetical protein